MSAITTMAIIAPTLAADPRAEAAIAMVSLQVRSDHCYYDAVVANLAAHVLELSNRQGVAGVVTSKREGDLALTFSAPTTAGASSTTYLDEVLRLNHLCYGFAATPAFEPIDFAADQWWVPGWLGGTP